MVFRSSMDNYTTRTTHYVNIIFIISTGILLHFYLNTYNGALIGTLLFLCIIYGFAYLAVATKFVIDSDTLVIKNALFPTTIKKENIEATRIIPYETLGLIGVFRMAGPFGNAGMYFSKELGNVILFSRKSSGDTVYIRTSEGKGYILAPDDPKGFLSELNAE